VPLAKQLQIASNGRNSSGFKGASTATAICASGFFVSISISNHDMRQQEVAGVSHGIVTLIAWKLWTSNVEA
jgi:hypothetical protein